MALLPPFLLGAWAGGLISYVVERNSLAEALRKLIFLGARGPQELADALQKYLFGDRAVAPGRGSREVTNLFKN